MKRKSEQGSITVEACITLFIFIFLICFMIGLFVLFMARSNINHTMLETAQSMSLDAYSTDKLVYDGSSSSSAKTFISGIINQMFGSESANSYFYSKEKWYIMKSDNEIEAETDPMKKEELSEQAHQERLQLAGLAKSRFVGFMTGGDEEKTRQILTSYNIEDGLDGLDFSETTVKGGDLYLTVKYKINYTFNPFGLAGINMKQTVRVKLIK